MNPPIIAANLRRKLAALYLTQDRLKLMIAHYETEVETLRLQIDALQAELAKELTP